MTSHSQTTGRTSCAGCASHRETQIRDTAFVRRRCHAGSKPMLPEFALRSGGVCGPARKLYVSSDDAANILPGQPGQPTTNQWQSGIIPPHVLPWYSVAPPGAWSPDGKILNAGGMGAMRSMFDLLIGLVVWRVLMFAPGSPLPPNSSHIVHFHEHSPTTWLDVVYALDVEFPSDLAGIYQNVMTSGRILP